MENNSIIPDDKSIAELKEFFEYFNNKVPNPEHYPIQFQYFVNIYKLNKGKQ